MAEREGFEPSEHLLSVHAISSRAPSAARAPLHKKAKLTYLFILSCSGVIVNLIMGLALQFATERPVFRDIRQLARSPEIMKAQALWLLIKSLH
jgi:hypothetical protein